MTCQFKLTVTIRHYSSMIFLLQTVQTDSYSIATNSGIGLAYTSIFRPFFVRILAVSCPIFM